MICYFIQSHKNPEQILRLVRVIKQSSPHSQVLINHDFSTSYLDLSSLGHYSGIDLIKRKKPAKRGDASLLMMYLEAVDWLLTNRPNFEWLVCLSGQDYPTQPISTIEKFLSQTEYDGFIRYWDVLSPESLWGKAGEKRFFGQYVSLPEWTSWFLRKLGRIEPFTPLLVQWRFSLLGLKARSHPFNEQFKCYGGWYWHTLSKKCVKYLREYLNEHPELFKYYQKTLAPEESIVQTVLVNSQKFNLCNDDKRYVEFPADIRSGNARLLTTEDYPQITCGDFHFARKIDSQYDRQLLDMLDERILYCMINS
ncbi:beta-1,6-N-acetylglucosaminyltransferase [Chroococcidiopsis sp. TS-821]|uniref:beta-1,6-N-acetylglucosaminyltransferase n=1 Tax=Chroococcidiopsis sp. TS-821 TaxID=1378066 RepID=UPI000CEDB085|nr:beta-1,6-N-acetylglucosaminyltransferase [Chroococcidiopsis sp. TS-821]PPS43126.1 core-2/I-branching enzyme [Chroococcidiopsis sp. TS-821]